MSFRWRSFEACTHIFPRTKQLTIKKCSNIFQWLRNYFFCQEQGITLSHKCDFPLQAFCNFVNSCKKQTNEKKKQHLELVQLREFIYHHLCHGNIASAYVNYILFLTSTTKCQIAQHISLNNLCMCSLKKKKKPMIWFGFHTYYTQRHPRSS